MQSYVALITLFFLPASGHSAHSQVLVRHIAGWTVNVHTDPFSGGHMCKVSTPKIDYQRQALVLHLSRAKDTTGAIYRIDNGAPRLASANDVEIARLGFALNNDDLDNPSGGLVRIPLGQLVGASSIEVETEAFGRPTHFKIGGLRTVLDAAQAAGCKAGDFQ